MRCTFHICSCRLYGQSNNSLCSARRHTASGQAREHRRANSRLAPTVLAHAQVLSDTRLRHAYDYALEHPEELMYNRMRFYNARAYKYWQTDARAVVLGFIVLVSGVQYVNQHFVYQSVRPALCLGPAQ